MKEKNTEQFAGWLMAIGFWEDLESGAVNMMESASRNYFDQAAWDAGENVRDEFFHEWDGDDLPFEQSFLDQVDEERVVRELINSAEWKCGVLSTDVDHEFIARAKEWANRFKSINKHKLEDKEAVTQALTKVWVRQIYQHIKKGSNFKTAIATELAA